VRVLITGREGQLVTSLIERGGGREGLELIALGRPNLDLELPGSAERAVRNIAPDVVISAAAYTAVDQAEDEPERAFRVNGEAPGELAAAAQAAGVRIIHISTDYVFDGTSAEAYREDAPTNPIGIYGKSKLLGEERVREANPDHVIIHTAWVYSPFGRNFLKTMMALAETREQVGVVADQRGNPTSALDIADGLLALLACWQNDDTSGLGETYHLAGTGMATWCDFAAHIFADCARLGRATATACPIATSDYPTRAVRPTNSMLDSGKFVATFGYRAPNWRNSATAVVERLA
jgi:dTDP-4-dehydrorhamnose reductase